jgi:hypothetical protein
MLEYVVPEIAFLLPDLQSKKAKDTLIGRFECDQNLTILREVEPLQWLVFMHDD